MKRLFFFFIFFFLIVASNVPVSFAQEDANIDIDTASQEASMPTPTGADYQLPYPGLLPDSPLYFLKIFRDRLIDFLIADPLKKAEFDLLQADKHATMAVALVVKGKSQLAESTLSKGENYFETGIGQLTLAKNQGMDVDALTKRYLLALTKHKELTAGLVAGASKDIKKKLENIDERLESFEKQVNNLSQK